MAADALDLITVAAATAQLAAGGVTLNAAQAAVLQPLVTAASRELQKELNRYIPAADYHEIATPTQGRPDRNEPARVALANYPVNGSPVVFSGPVAALTVVNTDQATNQFAHVGATLTGDPDVQLTPTGLTLTRLASGVQHADAVTWTTATPYTTIASVAATINALGGGWSATAATGTPDLSLWPAAYLCGVREAKSAFSPGASLTLFGTVIGDYGVDRVTGILSLAPSRPAGAGWGGGLGGWVGAEDDDPDGYGWGGMVRVFYNAGYATIPAELQNMTALMVKSMLDTLPVDSTLQSENAKDYSYTARAVIGSLPAGVWQRAMKYKAWRV